MPVHPLIQRVVNTPDRMTATPGLDAVCLRIPQFYFTFAGNLWDAMELTFIVQDGQETEADWFEALRQSKALFTTDLFAASGVTNQPSGSSLEFSQGYADCINTWFHNKLRKQLDPRIIENVLWDWEGVDLDRIGYEYNRWYEAVKIIGARTCSNFAWAKRNELLLEYVQETPTPIPALPTYLTFDENSGWDWEDIIEPLLDRNPGAVVYVGDPWIYGGATPYGQLIDNILAKSPRLIIQFPTTGVDGVTLPEGESRATQDAIIQAKIEALLGVGE